MCSPTVSPSLSVERGTVLTYGTRTLEAFVSREFIAITLLILRISKLIISACILIRKLSYVIV